MNRELIRRHNSVVSAKDSVYHLGDFSWRDPTKYLKELNGTHYLIRGNHDPKESMAAGFKWVKDTAMLTVDKGSFVWLSHYAHLVWNRKHYGIPHLFGHTHGSLREPQQNSLDVGVDCWDYFPVSLAELKRELNF
jgi:calcineurin-like phosphoesterase family protein